MGFLGYDWCLRIPPKKVEGGVVLAVSTITETDRKLLFFFASVTSHLL